MERIRSAQIVFFSGTGGTRRIAEHFRAAFAARAVNVTVTELDAKPHPTADADLLLMLFPVYAANAPQPVGEWIAAAPEGGGKPAAVISVSGGGEVSPNTACRRPTVRGLEKKGYAVVYERMLVMPSNFIMPYGDALSALLMRLAPRRAEAAVDELLAGTVRRAKPSLIDRAATACASMEHVGSRWFGKHLRANGDCSGCGWCAAHCPRGNITLTAVKPVFGSRCVLCLRCVYGCPRKAIVSGRLKRLVLKEGYDLDALEARMRNMPEAEAEEPDVKGAAFKGVRAYIREG